MAGQKKILLDSNSYLRLACSIHPLLSVEFSENRYCLYVCPQLEKEYRFGARLRTKFEWVLETRYIENRKRKITISNKQKKQIASDVAFLRSFALDIEFPPNETIPSDVDLEVLATGAVLEIPVVTDDRGMHRMAENFGVETLSTLELLKLMLESGYVKKEKVIEIVSYWVYDNDLPAKFREEWVKLFEWPIPRE